MDLTQAEAVMDVISAGSDLALKAAQTQLDGGIGAQVDELKDNLVHVLAHIEAYIDFPDEDISPDTASDLLARLRSMEEKLDTLLKTAEGGRLLREGIRTAIAGSPNVGKSSLLNTLLGYDRAIVSNIAGTTRDTVEESIQLAGLALRLIDTLEIVTPGVTTPVSRLSGGNVQKVLLGREIESEPQLLITAYPVRGLDINSSYTIYDLLNEQRKKAWQCSSSEKISMCCWSCATGSWCCAMERSPAF